MKIPYSALSLCNFTNTLKLKNINLRKFTTNFGSFRVETHSCTFYISDKSGQVNSIMYRAIDNRVSEVDLCNFINKLYTALSIELKENGMKNLWFIQELLQTIIFAKKKLKTSTSILDLKQSESKFYAEFPWILEKYNNLKSKLEQDI